MAGITVNTPIVSKPPSTRTRPITTKAPPKPRPPKVVHVKAPKPPTQPSARSAGAAGRAAVPFTATSNTSGIPPGTVATDADLNSLGNGHQTAFAIEQEANQAMQRQNLLGAIATGASVSSQQARQFGITIGQIPIGPAPRAGGGGGGRSGGGTARPPAPPRPPKVTAPLQLTDSGLQGHDSRVSGPGTLSPIAPVTTRRPR